MSSSSSTPPAESRTGLARWRHEAAPRILIGIWCLLIAFAVVSLANPPWLASLARPGAASEAGSYADRGDRLARSGDFRNALLFYERALKADPTHIGARVNCAIAYGQLGRHDEGIRLLRDALAGETRGRGLILYNIAELQRMRGDKDRALAAYQDALGAGARPELVHARIGDILERAGDRDGAREAYVRALAAWKDPLVHYRNMLRQAYETISEPERITAIEEALARETTSADLHRYDLEFLQGQIDGYPEVARIAQRVASLD